MSLPTPNLDDRTYQDYVDEALRLIPTFCPEWTNVSHSDPGVALIELFAWMSEVITYRLNQVPESFYIRMLDLMGLEPFPPRAAHAVVTFWFDPDFSDPVRVPAGTEIMTAGDDPVVFSTSADRVFRPPSLIGAMMSTAAVSEHQAFVDIWDDLRSDSRTASALDFVEGDTLYLGFADSLADHVIRLDLEAHLDGMGVPTPPEFSWEVWSGEGFAPILVIEDTSKMLRDGAVVLGIGSSSEPREIGGQRAHWIRVRSAPHGPHPSVSLGSIRASMVGGMTSAENSFRVYDEVIGVSDGRPDQRFRCLQSPVLSRTDDETVTVDDAIWSEVSSFIDSGPSDRHFVWDSSSGEIRFGPDIRSSDGTVRRHGDTPPVGSRVSVTAYRCGGGERGNVGASTLRVLSSPIPGVDHVDNMFAATGGVDGESVEDVIRRGPEELRRGRQVITTSDFERAALEGHPGIARARCLAPASPGEPVRLLIVPRVERTSGARDLDSLALSTDLVRSLIESLDERRVLGTEVEIGTPFYQGATVAVRLTASRGRRASLVQDHVLAEIHRFLDPAIGRFGDGWQFGEDLRSVMIFQLVEGIEGVERVDDVALFDADLRTHERIGFAKSKLYLPDDSLFVPFGCRVVVR